MKQLSILLPSGPRNQEKLARILANIRETVSDMSQIEVVVCLDAEPNFPDGWIDRIGDSLIRVYAKPSKYRGRFFDAAWRASTGKWLLMGNDDILFKTKNWDTMIPYDKYPDELVVFGLKDNQYNQLFFCHPIWSRKVMEMDIDLFTPNYQITKCDNTIFDIHPPTRRVYLPDIELEHIQTPYGPEWKTAYDEDNEVYLSHTNQRNVVLNRIMAELGMTQRVMIGVPTAENARRADFYDHLLQLAKPQDSVVLFRHGQSIAENRNEIVQQALIHNCSHVFFIDDDVICPPDTLFKLLACDRPIVTALQLKRNFPHLPMIAGMKDVGIQKDQILLDPSQCGLIPIKHAGLGATLIHTNVFKSMEKPWFRLGHMIPDQMQEDVDFYLRAKEFNYQAFCDLETRVGHIASVVIWPERMQGQWVTTYDTNGKARISSPQMYPEPEFSS